MTAEQAVDEYMDRWIAQRTALQAEVEQLRTATAAVEVEHAKVCSRGRVGG